MKISSRDVGGGSFAFTGIGALEAVVEAETSAPVEAPAIPFQPQVIATAALTVTGNRPPEDVPFQPQTIATNALSVSGNRPADEIPFQPQTIDTATLQVSGTGEGLAVGAATPPEGPGGVAFEPLTATAGGLGMTGTRTEAVAFEPLSATAGGLDMTGTRTEPVAFEPLTMTAGGLSMTGTRQSE